MTPGSPTSQVTAKTPVQRLLDFIAASGWRSADAVRAALAEVPPAQRADVTALTKILAQRGVLTWYQAAQLQQGKAAGLVVGGHLILDQVGQGGMGVVYRAWHQRLGRPVALKVLTAERTVSASALKRFRREAQVAARLNHPNIVSAIDADRDDSGQFIVMEYVEGVDLSKQVKKHGPLPLNQAIAAVMQAAQGLEHAHSCGIIHRDVKPSNLLRDPAGVVRVLDLGLAGFEDGGEVTSDLTKSGAVLGTCDYMAPEQAADIRNVDRRADIYALGCTFYFLLTGKTMYPGTSVMDKLMAHREQAIPSLRARRPDVPEAVDRVYQRMVAKRPEDRFNSMTDVMVALQGGLRHQASRHTGVQASPPSTRRLLAAGTPSNRNLPKPGRRRLRRWVLIVGFLLALVLGGLAGLGGVSWYLRTRPAKAAPTSAATPPAARPPAAPPAGGLSAEQRLERVVAQLKELNPGFDGVVEHHMADGKVTELSFRTDQVASIAPLSELTDLHSLSATGSAVGLGKLADLAPLAGLPLETVNFLNNSQLAELAPLRGAALKRVFLTNTRVASVASLQGCPLTHLSLAGDRGVRDLTPLTGMALQELNLAHTNVIDIKPLTGMPLVRLDCRNTSVRDYTPIKDMPLKEVFVDYPKREQARMLELLRGIKTLEIINNRKAPEYFQRMMTEKAGA